MPNFKFSNLTGKKVSFKFENETHDGNVDDFTEENTFAFTLQPGESFMDEQSEQCRRVRKVIQILLQSFKAEELKGVQLYFDLKIEGYKTVQNVSLNQFGIFGFQIESEANSSKSYCIVRLVRDRGETVVYFESNCVVHNATNKQLQLVPFNTQSGRHTDKSIILENN